MGKSLKNGVTPDDVIASYGADALRLYEMFLGPLDQDRPWDTQAISGIVRFLQRVWRALVDEETGERARDRRDPVATSSGAPRTGRSPRCATTSRASASIPPSPR